MFAQNLGLIRRSTGAGPEAWGSGPASPVARGDMGAAALSPRWDLDPARL